MMEEDFDLVIDKETGYYNRSICRDRMKASEMIQGLYRGSEKTIILSSGMHCIFMVLQTVLKQKSSKILDPKEKRSVLISNEMYTDTKNKVLRRFKKEYQDKLNFVTFSYKKKNHFSNLIRNYASSLACVFFESVSNPSSYIVDFEQLRSLRDDCYVIIDNTWISPLGLNPFDFNADCVVDSCSKYLSAGKCIAGHLTFRSSEDPVCTEVEDLTRVMGLHVSPIHCRLIQSGITSLTHNLRVISERTEAVVKSLLNLQLILEISHPMLETHISHENWEKYNMGEQRNGGLPGVVWFKTKIREEVYKSKEMKKLLGETITKHSIVFATSFGKPYTLVDMLPKRENGNLWLRVSIGYGEKEKVEDIITSLENIIKDLN